MEITNEEYLEKEEDTQYGRFLTFNLGEEVYGIEIKFVTEIIGMQPITKIPEVDAFIKGIINLRGKIIPVIDMRLKFGKEPIEYDDRTCVVVVDTGEIVVGLIVDKVAEVVTIDDSEISPPPSHKTGIRNRYLKGIGKIDGNVKLLLDCNTLFNEEESDKIGQLE